MWGMYLIAPVIGAVLAAVLYDRVLAQADKPEV
jgi:glycerol uptake facilitator-like aquaporin